MYRDAVDACFEASYLPDVHDDINKIFVYCNEVEKQFVGDDKSRLLCVVPLQYKGQGSGALVTHQFQNVVKKLNKLKIYEFHVQLRDNEGNFIHFDSGSVNIQAIII